MTATYTFDVFSSLDGFGAASGDWTGYWGKQGPELLDRRLALYAAENRMVFGANTYREFSQMLADTSKSSLDDARESDRRTQSLPHTEQLIEQQPTEPGRDHRLNQNGHRRGGRWQTSQRRGD